jgi:CBS domain-containing membrane protein
MGQLKVRDLMTDKVYSIKEEEDLARLNDLMNDIRIRHVPVVDEGGELVGIVSHRDLLRSALDTEGVLPISEQRDLLRSTAVREIMVTEVETTEPNQEIQEAGRTMLDNKLGCLPVLEGRQLVGILTEADFVKYVVQKFEE